jgi:hypothetical protein
VSTRTCYADNTVQALRARVRNGRLVLDEPTNLPEGAEVELLPADDLDDEERAELNSSLDEGIEQARAGNTIDGPAFFASLRANG